MRYALCVFDGDNVGLGCNSHQITLSMLHIKERLFPQIVVDHNNNVKFETMDIALLYQARNADMSPSTLTALQRCGVETVPVTHEGPQALDAALHQFVTSRLLAIKGRTLVMLASNDKDISNWSTEFQKMSINKDNEVISIVKDQYINACMLLHCNGIYCLQDQSPKDWRPVWTDMLKNNVAPKDFRVGVRNNLNLAGYYPKYGNQKQRYLY